MTTSRNVSEKSDKWNIQPRQSDLSAKGVEKRIKALLDGRDMSWLSRETGISTSTISDYMRGVKPRSDKAIAIAKALKSSVEWIFGDSQPATSPWQLMSVDEAEWVQLPRYDLGMFTDGTKPEIHASTPVPKYWLRSISAGTEKLWVTTVPGNVGDWLSEGEEIICADLDGEIVDGRIYIFMIDGHAIIRRVFVRPEGYQLITGDPMTPALTVPRDFAEIGPFPVARVVGKFRFNPM